MVRRMRNRTDVDIIREIAYENGSYHTNSYYIEKSASTYGRQVTQSSVISAIGVYRLRRDIPLKLRRSGRHFLSDCDYDVRLAQRVLSDA